MVFQSNPAEVFEMSPQRGSPGEWLEMHQEGPDACNVQMDAAGVAYWHTLSASQKTQASLEWNDAARTGFVDGYAHIRMVGGFIMRKDGQELTLFNKDLWHVQQVVLHGQVGNEMRQMSRQLMSPLRPRQPLQLQPVMPQVNRARPSQPQPGYDTQVPSYQQQGRQNYDAYGQQGYQEPGQQDDGWGKQDKWVGWEAPPQQHQQGPSALKHTSFSRRGIARANA